MRVQISKDITKYKTKVYFGLTFRQIIALGVTLAINIPLYSKLIKRFTEDTTTWIILIIALPLMAIGWLEPQGMAFEKYVGVIIWEFITPQVRPYKIEEGDINVQQEVEKEG